MRTLVEIGDRSIHGFAFGDFDAAIDRFILCGRVYRRVEGSYQIGPGVFLCLEMFLPRGHLLLGDDDAVGETLRVKRLSEVDDRIVNLWNGIVRESLASDSGRLRLVVDAEAA